MQNASETQTQSAQRALSARKIGTDWRVEFDADHTIIIIIIPHVRYDDYYYWCVNFWRPF